ncbi:SPOR domain-containing protein [Jiella sp. M17.18]|uniref:SPOR domain-containing protein n=1 Tax=Jiella sp. M17.18 TaxID=3234247 RepID=UPI0034DE24E0
MRDLTGSGSGNAGPASADLDDPFEELARLLDEPLEALPRPVSHVENQARLSPQAGESRGGSGVSAAERPSTAGHSASEPSVGAEFASEDATALAAALDVDGDISAGFAEEFAVAMGDEVPQDASRTQGVALAAGPAAEAAVPSSKKRAGSASGLAGVFDEEIETALLGLSAPANPRETMIHRAEPFAPARMPEQPVAAPAGKVFDDFDDLIASELAAMKQAPVAAEPEAEPEYESLWQPQDDHDDYLEAARSLPDGQGRWASEAEGAEAGDDGAVRRASRAAAALRPKRPLGSGVALGAVVAVLAVGYGGYSLLTGSSPLAGNGGVLIVQADKDPVKVKPTDPGGRDIPNQNKAVYQRVESASADLVPSQPKLLKAEEKPIDLPVAPPERGPDPSDLPGVEVGGPIRQANAAETGTAPVQVADASASEQPMPGLAPRRVKTLTVRPDGTLAEVDSASGEAMDALRNNGALIQASARPVAIESSSDGQPQVAAAQAETAVAAETKPIVGQPAPNMPVPTLRPAMPAPVEVASAAPEEPAATPAKVSPTPERTAADPVRTASLPDSSAAPSASGPTPVVTETNGYYVQISSQPTEPLAQKSSQRLGQKFASVLGGHKMVILSAEIPGKGTYYRVRVAAASKDEASSLCGSLKSAGGSCFVSR